MNLFSDHIKFQDLAVATKLFHESREGFLKLFNNSPICMSMTTTTLGKRIYQRVNNKFLEKFGHTEAEIIGKTSVEVGILDESESLRVAMLIKENGRLNNDYVKCTAKDGTIVHTLSSIEFMEFNGETFLVSFFIDITKMAEQQTIIEQQVQQLEAANKELEAFSYSVSHDLRAPLRAISGFTQILEEDFHTVLNDEGKKILSTVQRSAEKMALMIDSLLDFSRLGKKSLLKTDIDMNILVEEVLNDLKRASHHSAEIRTGTLHPVKGDHALMKQVLINLISNGIKYSSKKKDPVVEISSEIQNNQVVYTIKDNGKGFDMKYAGKLFTVFQRLHSDQEFEGTGVGLAIVKRIIGKHGGTVRAESELGKGAAFSFTVPSSLA